MEQKKICPIDALEVDQDSVFCKEHRKTFEKWLKRNPHMINKPPKIVAMVFSNIVETKGHDFLEVIEKKEKEDKKRAKKKEKNKSHQESIEITKGDVGPIDLMEAESE